MNDTNFYVHAYKGVGNYSSFKNSIVYDPRSVVNVMLPSDSVQHVKCTVIC